MIGDQINDALYQSTVRLLRLASEGKVFTTPEAEVEVTLLLSEAASAATRAGSALFLPPVPRVIPDPDTIVAKPYDRRKDA